MENIQDPQSTIAARMLADFASSGTDTFVTEGAFPTIFVLSHIRRRLIPVCLLHEVRCQDGKQYVHASFNNPARTDYRLDFENVDEVKQLVRTEALRLSGLPEGHDRRLFPMKVEVSYDD